MSKIGLIDVDGHNFPNLALMKISKYHKSIGDSVSFVSIGNYDSIYVSKVFSFTHDSKLGFVNYDELHKGGTGYNAKTKLPGPIDSMIPDYSLYPQYAHAYGFLTRGCPNNCSWCIVPKKEGDIKSYMDIEDFLDNRKSAILMDNNVLTHAHGLAQIEKIIRLGIKVDFNQGLDARIIANDISIAELLSKVPWIKFIRVACDTIAQMETVKKALDNLVKFGIKKYKVFIYVLVKDIDDSLARVEFFKKHGYIHTFAQPFRNFTTNDPPPYELQRFARWVNRKQIFTTVEYKDYIQSKHEAYKK